MFGNKKNNPGMQTIFVDPEHPMFAAMQDLRRAEVDCQARVYQEQGMNADAARAAATAVSTAIHGSVPPVGHAAPIDSADISRAASSVASVVRHTSPASADADTRAFEGVQGCELPPHMRHGS